MPYDEKELYRYRIGDWQADYVNRPDDSKAFYVHNGTTKIDAKSFRAAIAIVNCLATNAAN